MVACNTLFTSSASAWVVTQDGWIIIRWSMLCLFVTYIMSYKFRDPMDYRFFLLTIFCAHFSSYVLLFFDDESEKSVKFAGANLLNSLKIFEVRKQDFPWGSKPLHGHYSDGVDAAKQAGKKVVETMKFLIGMWLIGG